MKLRLAADLSLPIEAATQTFLVVGKRGSGKSTTAVRLAEQLHAAGVPFVAIDPVDTWWGLKASGDGKGPGLPVYIFGGSHADLPLEATAGALMADVLIEHRFPAVLSVKHFSGRERGRFVADFTHRLFQKNREPLHMFLEEAHEVAPQNPYKGEEEMLGHVARIWKLGRSSGLGGSAVTQRPASLSKNITTQAEILIVHRTLGPQDVAAIREWIRYHGEREDILAQLSTLATGEAFIWAPDFPEGKPIGLRRVTIHQRETFDSAATPKAGERRVEPKTLAPVDLERLRDRMAATVERAKADDPKALRAEITRLHRELEAAKRAPTAAPTAPEVVRVEAILETQMAEVDRQAARLETAGDTLRGVGQSAIKAAVDLRDELHAVLRRVEIAIAGVQRSGVGRRSVPPTTAARPAPIRQRPDRARTQHTARGLTGTQQRVLDVAYDLTIRGITPTREGIAAWIPSANRIGGIHPNGGRYGSDLAALREQGYLDGSEPTQRGIEAARDLPRGREGAAAVLSGTQLRILEAVEAHRAPLTREQLAEQLGLHPNGGRFGSDLARLRTMGIITERGPIAPTAALYR